MGSTPIVGLVIRLCRLRSGSAIIKVVPQEFKRKLMNLGIFVSIKVTVLQNNRGFPLLIKSGGTQVILNRGMAREIMVEPI